MRNGQEVTLGGGRQRSLLAVLLVHANEVVSSDRLIDELWSEQPPETAATALHGFVSQLRKALEPGRASGAPGEVLLTRAPGYMLRVQPGAIDAAQFEELLADGRGALDAGEAGRAATALREALALWRGQALAGGDNAPSAHAESIRLEEARLEALGDRIDADLALGRDQELVSELEGLVEREPLRERLRGQLMLALYRSGRQAEALEHYQRARNTFRDRLGIEPSPRLRELEQAILRQDPELDEGLPRVRPRRVLRRRRRSLLPAAALLALTVVAAVVAGVVLTRDQLPLRGAPGSVAVVDPDSLRVVDTIEVGPGPTSVAFGHGSVWVASAGNDTVSRIDPESREVVDVIGVPSPVDLAIGSDAVWVAGGIDGTVTRIDPESNEVVAEIDLRGPDPFVPRTVNGVTAGAGGVWAAAAGEELVQIDPVRDTVAREVGIGSTPLAVESTAGAVWALSGAGRVLRLEPSSGALVSEVPIGSPGLFPHDLVIADDGLLGLAGDLWVVGRGSTQLERTLPTGGYTTAAADVPGPGLWAVTYEGGLVRFLDPDLGEPPRRVEVGSAPTAVVAAGGAVWVTIA